LAIAATWAALWVRELRAKGLSLSRGQSSIFTGRAARGGALASAFLRFVIFPVFRF
jgi:hypothetical protein